MLSTVSVDRTAYQTDPQYLKLLPVREKLQKSLRDADRDVNDLTVKVNANSNIVVKVKHCLLRVVSNDESLTLVLVACVQNRFKQMLETAQTQRDEVAAELGKVLCSIVSGNLWKWVITHFSV